MIITPEDLPKIREKHKGQKIVFCSGTFDLPHVGHLLFFETCKRYGDILVAVVGKDENIRDYKGDKRPIMTDKIRLRMVDGMKPVDYALLDTYDAPKENQLILIDNLIERLKPDIYLIKEDAFNMPYRREIADRHNLDLVVLGRECLEGVGDVSTSDIIKKIKEL